MNLSKYIFLAALLFLTCAIVAQDVVFEKITTREGLSQNDVNAIYQDNQGFLWIGTHDGLNRFDGYSFKTYRVNPDSDVEGISSNLIFDIKEDAGGNLWIATSDEGICRFDVKNEVFTQFKNTPEDPDFLFSNQVITMLQAKDKSVWIGTRQFFNWNLSDYRS